MDLFKEFKTDKALEEGGVWQSYGPVSFLVARQNNKKYKKLMSKGFEANKFLFSRKSSTDEGDAKAEALIIDTMARTILLDWKVEEGQPDPEFNGQPLGPYSVERAKELLSIPDFRELIDGFSKDMDSYRIESVKEAAGE